MRRLFLAVAVGCLAAPLAGAVEQESLPPPAFTRGSLTRMETTGVGFANRVLAEDLRADPSLVSGAGAAVADLDGDGFPELFFCGLEVENRLYRNLGRWRFQEVTEAAGVGLPADLSRCAAFADLDGDGDPDLLVGVQTRGVRIFRNEGGLRFTSLGAGAGTVLPVAATTLALADLDRDGDLDLLVGVRAGPALRFHNRGDGTFTPVSDTAWTPAPPRDVRAAFFRDLNDDGLPDLLTAGGEGVAVWILRGDSLARLHAAALPVAAAQLADADADGQADLFLTLAQAASSSAQLWRGQAGGHFFDRSRQLGLAHHPVHGRVYGFDLELSGRADLLLGRPAPLPTDPPFLVLRPVPVGPAQTHSLAGVTRGPGGPGGALAADLDADGDLDWVVNATGAPAGLYRNDSGAPRLAVRLRGEGGNRDAVGARLELRSSGGWRQTLTVAAGDGEVPGWAHFPAPVEPLELSVRWPGGLRQEVRKVRPGQRLTLTPPAEAAVLPETAAVRWTEEDAARYPVGGNPGGEEGRPGLASDGRRIYGLTVAGAVQSRAEGQSWQVEANWPTGWRSLAWSDTDRDHTLELWLGGAGGPALFRRVGERWRQVEGLPSLPRHETAVALLPLDWNDDGYPDLLGLFETTGGERRVGLWRNNGQGGFVSAPEPVGWPPPGPWRAMTAADWAGDGRLELLLLPEGGATEIAVWRSGEKGWTRNPLPAEVQGRPFVAAQAADLDLDGRLDLVLDPGAPPSFGGEQPGQALWLRNDGRGGWESVGSWALREVRVIDANADRRPDVTGIHPEGRATVWRNTWAAPGFTLAVGGNAGNPVAIGARVRWRPAGGGPGLRWDLTASGSAAAPLLLLPPRAGELEVVWPDGRRASTTTPPPTGHALRLPWPVEPGD